MSPRSAPTEPAEHVYKTVDGHELRLLVYRPADAAAGQQRPAIVFFFGGGFVGGNIHQFRPHCRYLASRGMVAMTADYRVQQRHGTTPVESCLDGRSAVRWIRAHASELGVDPHRIAAGGGSAGGAVAALAGLVDDTPGDGVGSVDPTYTVSSRPDALVLFNPVVIYAPIADRELRPEKRLALYVQRWQRSAIPEVSAWHHVTSAAPPTIIFHGSADEIVPPATVRRFEEKMHACGVRCEVVWYEGQGHGFFNCGRGDGACFRETLTAADRFLASLGWLEGEPGVDAWMRAAPEE